MASNPDRMYHREVKRRFELSDMIVVGAKRPEHPEGVFNPDSLARILSLSKKIAALEHVVASELIGPANVDEVRSDGPGQVTFQWLLEAPPENQDEADRVRRSARSLPMLNGTVVSKDGRSLALYVPVTEKRFSRAVSLQISDLIEGLDGPETYYFAGLPVAEDTFGYEMFVQMAICAPLAGFAIFLLMWGFFRSLWLVLSPMIVALATVLITMGALIGAGFTVHIMSSMIAIFLMPTAVVDAVHILSEFAESYRAQGDARTAVREVVARLFTPMLYTSLTSAAGFFSLLLTPIPPVRVFGAFVGLGILLAFVLTIVVLPAYLMLLSDRQLESVLSARVGRQGLGRTQAALRCLRLIALGAPRTMVLLSLGLAVAGAIGISRIDINDNPVRWFRSSHPIRIADATLNRDLAGTYPAYLVLEPAEPLPDPVATAREALVKAEGNGTQGRARQEAFDALLERGREELALGLEDRIHEDEEGAPVWRAALSAYEDAERRGRIFSSPRWLAWIERLQGAAQSLPHVGKTTSVADLVKTVARALRGDEEGALSLPTTQEGVAQTLLTFQSSHRPRDLEHLMTPDARSAVIWFQLSSGDNLSMTAVRGAVETWIAEHPSPAPVRVRWAGLTHLNVVWQEKMVGGMLNSLLGAFVVVLLMMIFLFRSVLYGCLSMLPLAFTMVLVYGVTGWVGKDYDMPVAVLSSLSLGLSVDFAIHFLERSRGLAETYGSWSTALAMMFEGPGRAIARNAVVVAVGFLPLLAAPLVPYNTVGVLMAAIMAISALVTLVLLPALLALMAEASR